MTDQDIRIAVAIAAMNYKPGPNGTWGNESYTGMGEAHLISMGDRYLYDLNACAKFEKTLNVNELSQYADALDKVCVPVHICPLTHWQAVAMATARQRCEAFLRVKGLWKDGVR